MSAVTSSTVAADLDRFSRIVGACFPGGVGGDGGGVSNFEARVRVPGIERDPFDAAGFLGMSGAGP